MVSSSFQKSSALPFGKLQKFSAYTMVEDPMTSCGCFECIVGISPDLQGVVVVNREFPGMTPIGMSFPTLAGSIGGGIQTPGFIGIGRKYLTSKELHQRGRGVPAR